MDKNPLPSTPYNAETTPIVLIGLMGAGKTSIGRRLAQRLGVRFVDADEEIEAAAGCSIPEIFEVYGEKAFRDVEERVIERLLGEGHLVLATGGGAYMAEKTRQIIRDKAVSIWLRAELDVLVERTSRRGGRPLLDAGEPRKILQDLMDLRYPVYGQADIIVDTGVEGLDATLDKVYEKLTEHTAPDNNGTQP